MKGVAEEAETVGGEDFEREVARLEMERSICETVRGHRWVRTRDRMGQSFKSCLHCGAAIGRQALGLA